MRIVASKKDDILRRRDEWKEEYDVKLAEYYSQKDKYNQEYRRRAESIQQTVEGFLSEFDLLELDVRVSSDWQGAYEVRIECDESRKFEDISALSWNYCIELDSAGEIKSTTNSWSGLKATTPEQLDSLKQTVSCIETIMNLDWKTILSVKTPNISDYVTAEYPQDRSREFDDELLHAEIEDIIGTHKVVEYDNPKYYRGETYVGILSQTNSMFTIFEIHSTEIGKKTYEEVSKYPYKVRKSTFFDYVSKPLNIKEI